MKKATATSIISDIINISKNINSKPSDYISKNNFNIEKIENQKYRYYCRIKIKDWPWILSKISEVFWKYWLNIDQVLQHKHSLDEKINLPFVITLEKSKESNMIAAINEIQKFKFIKDKILTIRILD